MKTNGVRVKASCIDYEDDAMVLDLILNEDGTIAIDRQFGFTFDDKQKYPFILYKDKNPSVLLFNGILFYGDIYDNPISTIDIFNKIICVNELFTRRDYNRDNFTEYVYRITEVRKLT